MKESWKTINQLLNKRSKTTNIESLKDDKGNNIVDKQEIAETMNKFFCSIGKDLAKNVKEKPNTLLSGDYQINKEGKTFRFGAVTEQNIGDAIGKIKTAKSFGHDNVSSYFLKLALPFISGSLAHLFNIAIETSTFPDSWKIARVTPIYKVGEKCERSNYRPISVLPVIARLFEKLVFDQLYQYLDENGFLSPDQSGFRALHSTVTSLLKCTDDWYSGLDTGQMTGLIFIDLKKAFDTVDHEILCQKLYLYGVQDRELAWFKSYLSNRKQFARANGADSKIEEIDIGVPQESCLGPLLFLVYINNLSLVIKNSKTSVYADDTSIYCCSKDVPQLNREINEDLEQLDEWLMGNKLSLNVAKTHSMLIATQQKHKSLAYSDIRFDPKIREKEIEIRSKAKYLGVQIDDNLNWKEHIRAVSAKVSRAVGFLKYSKQYLPLSAVKTLYTSIVEPHFQYCCSVWGCCNAAEIQLLQKLQNRAARIVSNSSFNADIKPMFEILGWKTIQQLIDTQSKIVTFKSLKNLAPKYLCELFNKNIVCSSRNLRNTNTDVRLPKKNTAKGQKAFSFRGAKIWNSLSTEAKLAPSLYKFKGHVGG